MLAYEPLVDFVSPEGVRLLGIESTRGLGEWPTMRHVFDIDREAALYVEVDPLGELVAYAVGFDRYGDELLVPL